MLCRVLIFVNSSSTCRADARVCLLKVKKIIIGNKTKKKNTTKNRQPKQNMKKEKIIILSHSTESIESAIM